MVFYYVIASLTILLFMCSSIPVAPACGVYQPLSWLDIPEFLSWFPWYRITGIKDATETRVPTDLVEVVIWKVANMTWLTVMDYLCHKSPPICSVCRNHNPIISSFRTYHRVCNKNNTTGATCRSGTDYPYGHLSSFTICENACATYSRI